MDSILCFHHKAVLDQAQAVRLGTMCLSPLSHLAGPKEHFEEQKHWVGGGKEILLFSACKGQNMFL